jgi:hypothetical protein
MPGTEGEALAAGRASRADDPTASARGGYRQTKAGRHQQRVAGFTERPERVIQQRPFVLVIQKAGDIHRAKLARVVAQDIKLRQVYLCRLGVNALATERRRREMGLKIQKAADPTTRTRAALTGRREPLPG